MVKLNSNIVATAKQLILPAIYLLTVMGCVSKPPMIPKPVQNNWVIKAPMESLWKPSIQAFIDKGLQIEILDKETGLLVVEENFDGRAFTQYTADQYNFFMGRARVNVLFTKRDENTTQVTIKPALFGLGRAPFPIEVTSNGKLERNYYLLISASINTEKTYKWLEDAEPPKEEK